MRTRTPVLILMSLTIFLLAGCGGASSDTPDVTVSTNGTPVMVELYTDW